MTAEANDLPGMSAYDKAWIMASATMYAYGGDRNVPCNVEDVAARLGLEPREGPDADHVNARRIARMILGRYLMKGFAVRDVKVERLARQVLRHARAWPGIARPASGSFGAWRR